MAQTQTSETSMSMARELLPAGAAAVSAVVQVLPADPNHEIWSAPTPCADWDVRALLTHLTAEHLWAPRLLAGETLEEVGDDYEGDVLGADARTAWEEAITASLLAWADVEDEDVEIRMSYGPATRREYAQQMLVDLVVHGWDLAVATGQPYGPAPEAVEEVLAYERPRLAGGGGMPGIFGAAVDGSSQDPLHQAVALTGRDPGWRR
ncbi:TIGR03086 family metal-binding protein [Ornithinimicrobium panacihumi]|uniref:TIGR03086 family metal-binding protein n=1 Tax=Ornithinimicrobium panacihumi TaxID=2008449 RepID=UPI003F892CDF